MVEELRWQATTVLMIMRGYDGNNGYAGYNGTKCNKEIRAVVNDTKGYDACKSTRIKYDRYKRLCKRTWKIARRTTTETKYEK